MRLARPWISLAALVLLVAARAPKPPLPSSVAAVDSAKVKAAVTDFWAQWVAADTAGNVPALAALLSDSIRIDSKSLPAMVGKPAWQNFVESMIKTSKVLSEVITPDITIAVSDDLAYQNGNYVESTMTGKKKSTDYGRYASALERGADGKWRLRYIMSFSDSSVAAK